MFASLHEWMRLIWAKLLSKRQYTELQIRWMTSTDDQTSTRKFRENGFGLTFAEKVHGNTYLKSIFYALAICETVSRRQCAWCLVAVCLWNMTTNFHKCKHFICGHTVWNSFHELSLAHLQAKTLSRPANWPALLSGGNESWHAWMIYIFQLFKVYGLWFYQFRPNFICSQWKWMLIELSQVFATQNSKKASFVLEVVHIFTVRHFMGFGK